MSNLKVAIIYYTSTGANYQMALWAKAGAEAAGAEVKVLKVKETAPMQAIESNEAWKTTYERLKNEPEASMDDLEWADAIIFSAPTRYGSISSQFQSFFDQTGGLWAQGKLVNKVVSAMSSAQNPHGGQESTVLAIYKNMCHWGAVLAPVGYTDNTVFGAGGNPYGCTATVSMDGQIKTENLEPAVIHQAKRTVQIAQALKIGLNG
ncbi:NAD(P)H:quinone oxidoreductase [Anditalea andensis]|uniref:NAD(P)H:quinone oxidoreductase, type IV n=1 Tax=Anditalea andensis TaxID=1048983 RepID=A0A074KUB7_9BACT|nr:NAD(P)H:quinone oxidoreductase [Anditalea andensis]KEO72504.1 NAD(P)H:quinone oxidoreductase, type IV [Anditalea andensis]